MNLAAAQAASQDATWPDVAIVFLFVVLILGVCWLVSPAVKARNRKLAETCWQEWAEANRPLHGIHHVEVFKAGWEAGRAEGHREPQPGTFRRARARGFRVR